MRKSATAVLLQAGGNGNQETNSKGFNHHRSRICNPYRKENQ